MAVWIFFGVEEDGAGTGAATVGGRDVAVSAGGALAAEEPPARAQSARPPRSEGAGRRGARVGRDRCRFRRPLNVGWPA